jgi:hypothetical protein
LFVGCETGSVFQYANIDNNLGGNFSLVSNSFSNINLGLRTHPALANLISNDTLEMLVGDYAGGAVLYARASTSAIGLPTVSKAAEISLFPNPANDRLIVKVSVDESIRPKLTIVNLLGVVQLSQSLDVLTFEIPCSTWPSGIYFAKLEHKNGLLVQKFMVQH